MSKANRDKRNRWKEDTVESAETISIAMQELKEMVMYRADGLPTFMGLRTLAIMPMLNYHKDPVELNDQMHEFYKLNGINVVPGVDPTAVGV
jgi:hypothetical protein